MMNRADNEQHRHVFDLDDLVVVHHRLLRYQQSVEYAFEENQFELKPLTYRYSAQVSFSLHTGGREKKNERIILNCLSLFLSFCHFLLMKSKVNIFKIFDKYHTDLFTCRLPFHSHGILINQSESFHLPLW